MKVDKSASASRLSGTKRKRPDSTFTIRDDEVLPVDKAIATASSSTVGSVDALLALQSAEDTVAKDQRAARRGRRVMSALDHVHLAILSGQVSSAHLRMLQTATESDRDVVSDPDLGRILDSIDVRAAVELEKLKLARSR